MKFHFNLKETRIFQAVRWSRHPIFVWTRLLKKLFFILSILVFLLFLYGFLIGAFSAKTNSIFLGLTIIFLTLTIGLWVKVAFFNLKIKDPSPEVTIGEAMVNPEYNLAELLSFETARAVSKSIKWVKSKRLAKIDSTTLFYFLICDNPQLNFVFFRLLLDLNEIKKTLKTYLKQLTKSTGVEKVNLSFSEDFQNTILEALKIAQKKGNLRIGAGDMLTALARHDLIFKKILIDFKLKTQDIENLTWWLESIEKKYKEQKKWWEYQNLMRKGTLAKEWTAGYTLALDKYSTDWTEVARKQGFSEKIGHKKEIEQIERILARREYNNVLLIGEPGIGRKGIVRGLVAKTILGQSIAGVNYKRVVELDLPSLLAEISDPDEVAAILDKIFQEAISAENVILVIDEFHNFIGVKPSPGKIDISGIISSYLHLPQFQIVAVTTFAGLHKNIERSPSILNLFEKVEVSEISEREVMMILEHLTLLFEQRHKLFVSYQCLREIISLTRRFFPSIPFPKKAIDTLDEVMIYVKQSTREKIVLPKHIAKIISEKTQIPVGEIEAKEKETLLNLETLIHQRIINQEEAVKEISTALRRARAEVMVQKGPMGTFLFLGPTGVGKTETAKALAEIYFGSESRMIRLDMSEFQDVKDIPRLIGCAETSGLLTTPVREDPFSLILLDEIEKAHPNILNLFLQVLDEGFLTDGFGRKTDFKNSIIISTSNAGYQIILSAIKEKTDWSRIKQRLLDHLFEKAIFRPEFINRFDAVVIFKTLSKENILDITELMFKKLKQNLKEKGIEFIITSSLKEKIVELSYNPAFGAREIKRVIQNRVEDVLASALLSNELKRGDKVEIDPEGFKLKIN